MAWIESHQEMARHPKTRRVAVRLGISKAAVIGHLHLLWWWTLDFAPDGDLSGFDAEEVAAVAEWEGDAEQFLQALLDTGWLDEGRRVHNWGDYAGRLVTAREGIRERQRRCREKKRDAVPPQNDDVTQMSRPCHGDVTPMSQLCHADVTVTSQLRHGATQPDQTEQNRTQPNRERVARGRAGGPAERSAGVPSLSRSREVVSEPAPAGGGHSGGADNAFPPEPEDARRERREPGPEDGRGVSRGEEGLGGGRVLLRDGGVSFADDSPDGGPAGTEAVSMRTGVGSLPEAACGDVGSAARRGKSPLLGSREPSSPEGGEFAPGDGLVSNGAGSLPAGGEASAANRRGEPRGGEQSLRGEFSHDEGPVPTGGDSSHDDERRLLAGGEESWNEGGVVSGADADSPPAMADASFDPDRLSLQIRESLLAGAASPEDGGASPSWAAVSSGAGEAIPPARAFSSGRGEPVAEGVGVRNVHAPG